jgi:outer membrane immunogenic protein
MKAYALGLVLSLSLLGAERARAADVPLPEPPPIAPTSYYPTSYYPVSPPINWGGVYIGLNGGYGFGQSVWNNSFGSWRRIRGRRRCLRRYARHQLCGLRRLGIARFRGGFRLVGGERQWQLYQHWWAAGALGANPTCQTRIDSLTTFRFRAGYTWSHFLFYSTAGGVAGDFRISTQPTGAGHNPSPPLGWTAGVGVEYLFTDAISAKVEYLYVNLGSVGCPQNAVCSVDQAVTSSQSGGSVSFTENLIRVSVNYRFSW